MNKVEQAKVEREELYQRAEIAISKLFGDTSVSREQTAKDLRELISFIKIMLETFND